MFGELFKKEVFQGFQEVLGRLKKYEGGKCLKEFRVVWNKQKNGCLKRFNKLAKIWILYDKFLDDVWRSLKKL